MVESHLFFFGREGGWDLLFQVLNKDGKFERRIKRLKSLGQQVRGVEVEGPVILCSITLRLKVNLSSRRCQMAGGRRRKEQKQSLS
jgi:hypothetical protein